jgi:uncharacterized protein YfkK (UPF0435 family)
MNPDPVDQKMNQFLTDLYDVNQISGDELKLWLDSYSYKGFDRAKVLKQLFEKVQDHKVAQQIIMICGLLGPQRASLVKLLNGRIVNSYGIPASGQKGSEGISCQRITAATADLCAYFLKRTQYQKRLNLSCPAWLQFPSAGSIKLPDDLRQMHIEFSQKFSLVIGGVFNEQIYSQMIQNAYLDPKLNLFNEVLIQPPDPRLPTQVSTPASSSSALDVGRKTQPERKKPP